MVQMQSKNQGFRYILTCIDVLSCYAWADAIADIFTTSSRMPKRKQSDEDKEFYNAPVKRLLESKNIELFSVKSPNKAALVERFNRTLKSKIWRMFTSRNNQKWLNDLPHIVNAYNHSVHRVIKMKPADVDETNAMIVWERLYGKDPRHRSTLRNVHKGDRVRISKVKGKFEKGYLPNWSREEFTVDNINTKFLPSMVRLKDYHGEYIEGGFYGDEIQKIKRDADDDVYDIEKVIRQKRKDGQIWYLVKWLGYDDSFNSWIRKNDVVQTYNRN